MVTSCGRTPSSSAAICASTVRMPSPISVTPVTILAVPPSSISAQAPARSTVAVRAMPYQQARRRVRASLAITPPRSWLASAALSKRAPSEQGGRAPSPPRSPRVSPRDGRRAGFPARGLFGGIERAAAGSPSRAVCLVWVMAPSRIALMRRISNGSSPSFSAQMSRCDLGRELRLQRAEGAERTRRRVVGVDAVGVDLARSEWRRARRPGSRPCASRLRSTCRRRRRRRSSLISTARMRPSRVRPICRSCATDGAWRWR